MGKRIEGKKKRKSVKANVTSKFSAKRKLSRMGKKVQKGKAGPNTEFITRSAAIRKLQITLKDFRRLCILKGIYPRVPSKALKGNDKVYYDIKDISYISHEPLLERFREFKAFMKKIKRTAGRNQFGEARRQNEYKPRIVLDHLVKERYPRFIDALRDLDDALCMIFLFAALPSAGRITTEKTLVCQKLAREWQYYIARSHTLRKCFISIKGIYYQAEIQGESITWLVPHAFTQYIPQEIDLRVMITFVDFYEVLLAFVLYKLYHLQGWQYPPKVDKSLEKEGFCLLAMKTESLTVPVNGDGSSQEAAQAAADNSNDANKEKGKNGKKNAGKATAAAGSSSMEIVLDADLLQKIQGGGKGGNGDDEDEEEEDDEEDEDDQVDIIQPLKQAFSDLQQVANSSKTAAAEKEGDLNVRQEQEMEEAEEQRIFQQQQQLEQQGGENGGNSAKSPALIFSSLYFFINREVPLTMMQLLITAFGGRLGWEDSTGGTTSPYDRNDVRITHQIIDRPLQGNSSHSNREYIQPQWVVDSINARCLLPTRLYQSGVSKLPPHLSPFVNDVQEGYVPEFKDEMEKYQVEAGVIGKDEASRHRLGEQEANKNKNKKEKMNVDTEKEEESEDEEEDDEDEDDEDEDNEEDEEAEEEAPEELYEVPVAATNKEKNKNNSKQGQAQQRQEEEAKSLKSKVVAVEKKQQQAAKAPAAATASNKKTKANSSNNAEQNPQAGPRAIIQQPKQSAAGAAKQTEEDEVQELRVQMMPRKTKKLFDKMQYGIQKKQEKIATLEKKRVRQPPQEQPQPVAAAKTTEGSSKKKAKKN